MLKSRRRSIPTVGVQKRSGHAATLWKPRVDSSQSAKIRQRGKAKVQTDEQAQGKAGATSDQQAQDKNATKTDQGATASITNVTVEQKTQITQVIRETKVAPVTNIDFDISVGIEVPRHKVRLHRLPARIVRIVPAYESYEYFLLADGRIVIVDPDTLKIVLILT